MKADCKCIERYAKPFRQLLEDSKYVKILWGLYVCFAKASAKKPKVKERFNCGVVHTLLAGVLCSNQSLAKDSFPLKILLLESLKEFEILNSFSFNYYK